MCFHIFVDSALLVTRSNLFNSGLNTNFSNSQPVYTMYMSLKLIICSSSLWQLAFPKGLGAAAGRPRVPPSSPVIFDVNLVYIPGISDLDE